MAEGAQLDITTLSPDSLLFLRKRKDAAKQEMLDDGELRQDLYLIHFEHPHIDLHSIEPFAASNPCGYNPSIEWVAMMLKG